MRAKSREVLDNGEDGSTDRSTTQMNTNRGLASDIRSGMRRNSLAFANRLRNYSMHHSGGGGRTPPSVPVTRGEGAPTMYSMASFERTKASRREREARQVYLDAHAVKKEKEKNQRLRETAKATYGPSRVNHAHERLLLKYSRTHPELLQATVEAHRDYGSHHLAIRNTWQ